MEQEKTTKISIAIAAENMVIVTAPSSTGFEWIYHSSSEMPPRHVSQSPPQQIMIQTISTTAAHLQNENKQTITGKYRSIFWYFGIKFVKIGQQWGEISRHSASIESLVGEK